nr:DUF4349 domain-containing protein [Candidatus Electrothrix aestuarii]
MIIYLIIAMSVLSGCGQNELNPYQAKKTFDVISDSEASQRDATKFLAYEHYITVDINEEELTPAYRKAVAACVDDRKNNCTILDAKISSGKYATAHIRLRVKPKGVNKILESVANKGDVVEESTHVEDLALPVADNEKRLKMLTSHRDRLLSLQEKADNDIESLIKISEELAKVQSELENARGRNAHLLQRVDMDIVNVTFTVEGNRSFWTPIEQSLSRFLSRFSQGISNVITGLAYFLPWLFVIIPALFGFRSFWQRKKKMR